MPNRRPLDLRLLRDLIRPLQVLAALGWVPKSRERASVRGPCPVHVSRSAGSRSFSVGDTWWRCHSCRAHGDGVALWAAVRRVPVLEAAYQLCREFQIAPPYL